LDIFRKCITVSGIGPKGAMSILSIMDADSLRMAILSGDAKSISKAPGIGNKTAERLILELKDKISVEDVLGSATAPRETAQAMENEVAKEAVEALTALGYTAKDAMKAVREVMQEDMTDVEQVLKLALKQML